eukprot:gene11898-18353_t
MPRRLKKAEKTAPKGDQTPSASSSRQPVIAVAMVAIALVGAGRTVNLWGDTGPSVQEVSRVVPCGIPPFKTFAQIGPEPGERWEICIEDEEPVYAIGLSSKPRAFYVEGLLKPIEIKKMLIKTLPLLNPAVLRNATDGSMLTNTTWRQSKYLTFLGRGGARTLNKRISQVLRLSDDFIANATIQVQRYKEGDRYLPHFDSSALNELGKPEDKEKLDYFPFSARLATVVMYLETSPSGHTVFPFSNRAVQTNNNMSEAYYTQAPRLNADFWFDYCRNLDTYPGISIAPKQGDAVVFYNHHVPSEGVLGQMDEYSYHGSCPVAPGGQKTMANYW